MSLPKGYQWEDRTDQSDEELMAYVLDHEGDRRYELMDEWELRHYEGPIIAWVGRREEAELIIRAMHTPWTLEVKDEST